jgi:predicted nicotinamide N-methyase
MSAVTLFPKDEEFLQLQLKDRFDSVEAIVDTLRDALRDARQDTSVWTREAVIEILQWCKRAGACGGNLGALLQQEGVPDVLTRCSTEMSRACCNGAALDEELELCASALSNACGGTACSLGDFLFRVHGMPDVVIGFTDYVSGETGGRLWAGAIILTVWFLENNIFDNWLLSNKETVSIVEIGCGPALVSAALCKWFCTRANVLKSRASLSMHITDVSEHVVAEASKTIAVRNACCNPMVFGDAELRWTCDTLNFASIAEELIGSFDVLYGSDVVYDYTIAAHVPVAMAKLLRAGTGVAYLCCESHRDAMKDFVTNVQRAFSEYLSVEMYAVNVALREHVLPAGVNPLCSIMIFRRTETQWKS